MSRHYTPAEDAILLEHYTARGMYGLADLLPGRTPGSIAHRAVRLGTYARRRWTEADNEELRALWQTTASLEQIARTCRRTVATVYHHAQHNLKLPVGLLPGHEYLRAACVRTGYHAASLERILAWAGVAMRPVRARPSEGRGKRPPARFRCVDPRVVDAAIRAWHRTEPVQAAAKARGLCGATLREWLQRANVRDLRPRAGKFHWRVASDVIDRVVRERRAA